MRARSALALVLAAAALTAAGSAAGSRTDGAVNLIATPAVKAALRAAFLRTHSTLAPARVKGPLKGLTYYGRYRSTEYAVATFSLARLGTTDQPEVFRRPVGGTWKDLGDTGGEICPNAVPLPLIKVWHFVPTSYSVIGGKKISCYAPGP